MPPITMTIITRIKMGSPMPGCTDKIGLLIKPAKPASAPPSENTRALSKRMFTPKAATMVGLSEPARINMPTRVLAINK